MPQEVVSRGAASDGRARAGHHLPWTRTRWTPPPMDAHALDAAWAGISGIGVTRWSSRVVGGPRARAALRVRTPLRVAVLQTWWRCTWGGAEAAVSCDGGDKVEAPGHSRARVCGMHMVVEGNAVPRGQPAAPNWHRADTIRCTTVVHYGKLAPQCASTFFRYGRALLCKALAATNPSGSVSKSAPNEESVKITATASRDDSEEGENLNSKDQEDVNMTFNEANADLDLARKMLDIARAIVAKSPEKSMEKVNIFYDLAEVYMKREDRDTAIGYYLEALGILEHLVIPDYIGVVQLNFRICLVFELASKAGDAIPYCAKAISVCQSLIQNLKNAKEALLADKDVSASAAKGHSGKFTLEDKISFLTRILARLQKKLEELEQAMSTPSSGIDKIMKRVVSQTSHEQNVSNTAAAK